MTKNNKGADMTDKEIMERAYVIMVTDDIVGWQYWFDQSKSYQSDVLLDRLGLKKAED